MPSTDTLPWAPLLTRTRSKNPELTLYGGIWVMHGDDPVLSIGDADSILWSRSLLKPWQWLSVYPILAANFRRLTLPHWAVMVASHQGDPAQLTLLNELASWLSPNETLQCPSCWPMSSKIAETLKQQNDTPQALYHPCAGKHLGALLTCQANHWPSGNYLESTHPLYSLLWSTLTQWLPQSPLNKPLTVDGCGMPNVGFSPTHLAWLYQQLMKPSAHNTPGLSILLECCQQHPELVGGEGRLDTRLMQAPIEDKQLTTTATVIAKEGADGLLGVGIQSTSRWPNGLGIVIKLASGYQAAQLEWVLMHVLETLQLKHPNLSESMLASGPCQDERYWDIRHPSAKVG